MVNICFESKDLVKSLELIMKCANKFSKSESTKDHDVALLAEPANQRIVIATHVLAQPAQVQFTLKTTFSEPCDDFCIELSVLFLKNVLDRLSGASHIDVDIHFDTGTLAFFQARELAPDLFCLHTRIERTESRRSYIQRFKMLSYKDAYDLTSPDNLNFQTVKRPDANMLKRVYELGKACGDIKEPSFAIKSGSQNSIYTHFFKAPFITGDVDPRAASIAVINLETLKVLSLLCAELTHSTESHLQIAVSSDCLVLMHSQFKVKLNTVDKNLTPHPPAPPTYRNDIKTTCTVDRIHVALEDVHVAELTTQDKVTLKMTDQATVTLQLTTAKGTANTHFEVSSTVESGPYPTLELPRPLLSKAISMFQREKGIYIVGLSTLEKTLLISDEDNTTFIRLHNVAQ